MQFLEISSLPLRSMCSSNYGRVNILTFGRTGTVLKGLSSSNKSLTSVHGLYDLGAYICCWHHILCCPCLSEIQITRNNALFILDLANSDLIFFASGL